MSEQQLARPKRPLSRRATPGGMPGAAAAHPARRLRVLIATDEPWATHHLRPLLTEVARRGWDLTQLVPDDDRVEPGDPVPVATPDDAPPADVLVVTGAGDWPADCAARFRRLPLVASALAHPPSGEAPRAKELRHRVRLLTASSPAEGRALGRAFGTRRPIRTVGSPRTDALPPRRPEPGLVLVLPGGAAPGAGLLRAAAERLAAAGRRVLLGPHPTPSRPGSFEAPAVEAAARATAVLGIPGPVFPLLAAVGTPLLGCTDPALAVPRHLLDVCSATIDDPDAAVAAVDAAEPPGPDALADAVGPVGGSAARLLDAWSERHRAAVIPLPGTAPGAPGVPAAPSAPAALRVDAA